MSRRAPGGLSSICLGTDAHSFPNPVFSEEPPAMTLVREAAGVSKNGSSTLSLGNDSRDQSSIQSSTSAAYEASAERSNVIATPRFIGPPGGKSTIHFGNDDARYVSSNYFARGSNQNSGNVLSERPTRLHCPPGGKASICLGTHADAPVKKPVSVRRSEDKENVRKQHFVAETGPPRKLHNDYDQRMRTREPPGGATSISLA